MSDPIEELSSSLDEVIEFLLKLIKRYRGGVDIFNDEDAVFIGEIFENLSSDIAAAEALSEDLMQEVSQKFDTLSKIILELQLLLQKEQGVTYEQHNAVKLLEGAITSWSAKYKAS